jgi:hypothetical protein
MLFFKKIPSIPRGHPLGIKQKNKKNERNLSSVSMLGKALGCGLYQNQGHSWVEGKVPIPKALCGRQ